MRSKAWIVLMLIGGVAAAQGPANEVSGTMEIPMGRAGPEAALRFALEDVRSSCDFRPGTKPYLKSLDAGPIPNGVEDGLTLAYVCIPSGDARLNEAGRDLTKSDAGRGLLQQSPTVDPIGFFGWDMTYGNAFDAAGAPRNDTMRKLFRDSWLGAPYMRSRINDELLQSLEGAQAAVLMDYQVQLPVYGGRMGMVIANTGKTGIVKGTGRGGRIHTRSVQPAVVRSIALALLTYQPIKPSTPPQPYDSPRVRAGVFVNAGYLGVVNVSIDGQVRQFVFSAEDMQDEGGPGPLARLLEPVLE